MTQNERILKEEVVCWQRSFKNANSLAAIESSKHAKEISMLEKSVQKHEAAKVVVDKDLEKVILDAKVAKLSIDELKQALEVAKLTGEEIKTNLKAKVDLEEARVSQAQDEKTLAQEALAKMEIEVGQNIFAGRDELIDLAM